MNKYKIGHIWYKQSELTLKKDKQLIHIYNKFTNEAFKNEDLRLADLPILLKKYSLEKIFFGIILNPIITPFYILSLKWINYLIFKKINLDSATNSQIKKIFEDFFLFNNLLIQKLSELNNFFGLILKQTKKEKS